MDGGTGCKAYPKGKIDEDNEPATPCTHQCAADGSTPSVPEIYSVCPVCVLLRIVRFFSQAYSVLPICYCQRASQNRHLARLDHRTHE